MYTQSKRYFVPAQRKGRPTKKKVCFEPTKSLLNNLNKRKREPIKCYNDGSLGEKTKTMKANNFLTIINLVTLSFSILPKNASQTL